MLDNMEIKDILKEFFSNIRCSQCHNLFDEDSISIVRNENNYTVIRITCHKCEKNIGIALLGIDKDSIKSSMEKLNEKKGNNSQIEVNRENTPITYDDVIDAHNFFFGLGEDWLKYLPEKDK